MTELEEREAVIAEALSWQGTAFHHQAGIKVQRDANGVITARGGADCAYSVYLIYKTALPYRIPDIKISDYSFSWAMHKETAEKEEYLQAVMSVAKETDDPKPGDVVLFHWGRAYSHGAIIINPGLPHIVHMTVDGGGFIQGRSDGGRLTQRDRKYFTLW